MKIKFNSDDDWPSDKTLRLYNLRIIVRSLFQEDSKHYKPFFFFMNVCMRYKNATI